MLDLYLGAGLLYWLRIGVLVALLGFTIYMARRRWQEGAPAHQARRIFYPWLVLVVGFANYLGVVYFLLAPVVIIYLLAILALWVVLPALISVALLDVGARLAEAERTGFWLVAGIVACLAMTVIWFGIFGLSALLTVPQLWLEYLALATIPAAAAISWWSFLPGDRAVADVSKAFE